MRCVDCGTLENVSVCQGDLDLCPSCEGKRFPNIAADRRQKQGAASKSKKPEASQSQSGKAIIVNELLCFVWNKIDVLPSDMIVKLCVDTYDDKDVEQAKRLLFDSCNFDRSRFIRRQGQNKRSNNVQDMLALFHELDECDVPCFVASDLSRLPPIDVSHIDVSVLIKEIRVLQREVSQLKGNSTLDNRETGLQAELVSLRVELNSMKESLLKQVTHSESHSEPQLLCNSEQKRDTGACITDTSPHFRHPNKEVAVSGEGLESDFDEQETIVKQVFRPSYCDVAKNARSSAINDQSSAKVISIGQGVTFDVPTRLPSTSSCHDYTSVNHRHRSARRSNKRSKTFITGSNTETCTLKAVNTAPRVELFVSRLSPQTTADEITSHLHNIGFKDVKSVPLQTKYDTYSSFKLITTSDNSKGILNPNVWPSGILVRKFYHARNTQQSS
ncbi:uncharacterized protein [Ptychodera flava]|uniref:uncharacterized protein n=1 Tax=Ptychodera flava TaxID=63121 RepID=UPI003969D15D